MTHKDYKGIHVEADFDLADQELDGYVKLYDIHQRMPLKSMELHLVQQDGAEYVDVKAVYHKAPFNRIDRITGYLVPDVRRWNDGKKAELKDRTIHGGSKLGQAAFRSYYGD